MAVNFVKFERGSKAIYNRKKQNHSLDENTLYFIYNNANAPEEGGELYLGYRLISGETTIPSLSDLSDTNIVSPSNGALLWYNNTTNKWEPATVEQVAGSALGDAIRSNVTIIPAEEGKTKAQLLATVLNPSEGDIAIAAGNPYVYDGSEWQPLTDSELRTNVNNLDTRVTTLETAVGNIDSQIAQAISTANHLVYEVKNSLNGFEPKNNTIYLVPSDNTAESDSYSEYLYIDGSFERLGTINDVSLEGYATTAQLNQAVQNLASVSYVDNAIQDLATESYVDNAISSIDFSNYVLRTEVGDISALNTITGNTNYTLAQEVESLYERLQWQELQD